LKWQIIFTVGTATQDWKVLSFQCLGERSAQIAQEMHMYVKCANFMTIKEAVRKNKQNIKEI
jgi:hypothetical protein